GARLSPAGAPVLVAMGVRVPHWLRRDAGNSSLFRRGSHGMALRAGVMPAAHRWIEGREDAVWIVAVDPDMAVIVRREHVGFVDRRRRIVRHGVIGDAMKARRTGCASGVP